MSLLKSLDELERLSNEATEREWDAGTIQFLFAPNVSQADAQLAAASRNALPEIIQAIRKMREALEFYSKGGNCSMDRWEHPELGSFIGKRARTCLKELGLE